MENEFDIWDELNKIINSTQNQKPKNKFEECKQNLYKLEAMLKMKTNEY